MAKRTRDAYVALAVQGITELLTAEHAAVRPELEAKLSDQRWPSLPVPIDPQHLTTAVGKLRREGVITETEASTRGGRRISVLHFANRRPRPPNR
jgi:hypothetical protein